MPAPFLSRPNASSHVYLSCVPQASESQLWSLLHAMEALELDGHWRLIDPALQGSILEYTLLTAVQKGWSLRSVPLEPAADVLLDEGGFDKR